MSPVTPDQPAANINVNERAAWLALLEELIRHDTTSNRSNLGLIEAIRDLLRAHDVEAWLVYDSGRQKANLFSTLAAVRGGAEGGSVAVGHSGGGPGTRQ